MYEQSNKGKHNMQIIEVVSTGYELLTPPTFDDTRQKFTVDTSVNDVGLNALGLIAPVIGDVNGRLGCTQRTIFSYSRSA